MKLRFFFAGALVLGAVWSCRAQLAPVPIFSAATEPKSDTVFTSTREIRDLLWDGKALWAATSGGILRHDVSGWRKWTRKAGLPSNEALGVALKNGQIKVRFPIHSAIFDGGKWTTSDEKPYQRAIPQITWKNQTVRATADGLEIGARKMALPPSNGTHISALLATKAGVLVALYGDGLWLFDGQWTRDARSEKLPETAHEITALANNEASLFLGTRRGGIFSEVGNRWSPLSPHGAEIYNANIQSFAEFRGVLWASTLDDGLIYGFAEDWRHVSTPTLSSSAPRQMLAFQNQLFVRFGGGLVDSFDGKTWTKNAFKTIPRKGVYALAGNKETLFAAGWGGWSEWDGQQWAPHFEVPELQGVPLMGLLVEGDNLWIATQSRGLGRFDRATKKFRWFDERDGLPDDWITALNSFDGKIFAGTFVGGLARLDGDKWHVFPELGGQNVTALAPSNGKLLAATRKGIWEIKDDSARKIEKPWMDSEVQALHSTKNGVWIGARTSLSYLAHPK